MTAGPRSRDLGVRYETHNADRGKGFLYGGAERVEAMRSLIDVTPSRALDLGCRDGALAESLGLDPANVVGVDIDQRSLAAASAAKRLRPCLADLWAPLLPLRSVAFDLVVAGEILEHVPFPDALVAEIARVVRPTGRAVGSVPNAFRLKNRLTFLAGREYETDPTHLRRFSIASLDRLLRSRFADVEIRPCVGRLTPLWPKMMANDLVWRAARPRAAG